jgi:two-component system nitrogen regulation response regulator NtrX
VGEIPLSMQVKLLRVLEERELTRIGGRHVIKVDFRLVTATNRNLDEEVRQGRFREDLFYRLNVVPLHVPPLRERRDDVPLLAQYFVDLLSRREGAPMRVLDASAIEALTQMEWPGNVRELRNTIERLLILASGPRVTSADVSRLTGARPSDSASLGTLLDIATFEAFKDAAERAYLLHKLRDFEWNVSETARALDMPRSNLYKKIERYALEREK